MAGLLDDLPNYWGDNTTKDPGTGLTQADRRDPLWAGLIQGGMGLLAAGQDITPAARAQMIAQAGQTYGGIPKAMMDQRSAGAQQVLQQQQIKAGASKLDAQTRLAALAKTPEFQAAVAKLEPEERMLLQAALDAGDMTHATSILSGASKARTAQAETLRKEKRDDAAADAKAKKEENQGIFGGTFEGRMRNVLIDGRTKPGWLDDPKNAAAYAQAHAHLSRARTVRVGMSEWQEPPLADISDYPPPNAAAAPTAPSVTEPKVEPVPPNEVRTDPAAGTESWTEGKTTYVANPDDSVDVYENGKKIKTVPPKEIPPAEQAKMNDAVALRAGINDSAQKFLQRWKASSPLERAAALVTKSHPLNRAWVNTMLQAKGPALYDLGVLNRGDLPQLQKALSDPETPMSAIFSRTEDVEGQVADMLSVMDARRMSKENSYKEQRRRRPPKAAAATKPGSTPEYVPNPADPNGPYILKQD